MNAKIDVREMARKANQGNSGKLAFDDGLENIQGSILDGMIKLSGKLSKKQMTEISTLIQCAMSNAYKMGFIRGANVPEMTQNGFVSLMYDRDFGEVGTWVVSDLFDITNPVKF
jgi:hypothetical protein